MVPLALGTQTGGSVLRPASFCGVIGFNPGFGGINRGGIKFAAESVDTIGIIARDLADVAICWRALSGSNNSDAPSPQSPPRLGLCAGPSWANAAPESTAAVEQVAAAVADAGAAVVSFELPGATAQLRDARICINSYERARGLAWEWQHHRDLISPAFQETLAAGWEISYEAYLAAVARVTSWRRWLDDAFAGIDAILTPAVNGVADKGLDSTGDPAFQELWTLLHAPAISLPLHESGGLPVGVQLVGRRHGGSALLRTASWVMDAAPPRAA
jgi:amidase